MKVFCNYSSPKALLNTSNTRKRNSIWAFFSFFVKANDSDIIHSRVADKHNLIWIGQTEVVLTETEFSIICIV